MHVCSSVRVRAPRLVLVVAEVVAVETVEVIVPARVREGVQSHVLVVVMEVQYIRHTNE